jgi:hypothetical protein
MMAGAFTLGKYIGDIGKVATEAAENSRVLKLKAGKLQGNGVVEERKLRRGESSVVIVDGRNCELKVINIVDGKTTDRVADVMFVCPPIQ